MTISELKISNCQGAWPRDTGVSCCLVSNDGLFEKATCSKKSFELGQTVKLLHADRVTGIGMRHALTYFASSFENSKYKELQLHKQQCVLLYRSTQSPVRCMMIKQAAKPEPNDIDIIIIDIMSS